MEQGTSDDGEDDGTPAAAPGSDDDDIEGTAPVRLASSCLAVSTRFVNSLSLHAHCCPGV